MSSKIWILFFGFFAAIAAVRGQSCCETMEAKGDFWSFKQTGKDCALNIDMFDGLKLAAALNHIDCNEFNTLIINGRHMQEPFLASEEDLAAIPAHTKVFYENIQSAQIEKEETGNNMKSLNLVGSEDFKFHPSLLDEAEFIEFDGVKLQYNSDERVFKLSQTEPKGVNGPRAESLVASNSKGYAPSDFEILLMVICGVQLLVISMIVIVSCSAKAGKKQQLSRVPTNSSISSEEFSDNDYLSRQVSTVSSDFGVETPEIHECTIMIDETKEKC